MTKSIWIVTATLSLWAWGQDVDRAAQQRGGVARLSPAPIAADVLTLTSESQLAPRRRALLNFIWGSDSLPSSQAVPRAATANCQINGLGNVAKTEELRIAMELNQEELACHFVASAPNGRLVVFNPGHACSVADGSDWRTDAGSYGDQRTIQTLLVDGYSVLVTFMPHYRPDDCPTGPDPHAWMFANLHPATGSVWKYFLEPITASLNYLVANAGPRGFPAYSEFDMVGLSGGGWTATVYAAIDTRIKISVHVAGSEPLEFWNNHVDNAEQTLPALYNVAAYRDLYVLGASGGGRRQVQVLNRRDKCCFMPGWNGLDLTTWEPAVRAYDVAVRSDIVHMGDHGMFRQEIDDASVTHQISRNALGNVILPELEGGRAHVSAASEADAFVRGGNGYLWHWSAAAGWEDTGLAMVGVAAVVINSSHPLDVFYRDQSNRLRQAWKTGSGWTSRSLGGVIISDPAAVSWGPGRFDIVAFGGNYALYHWSSAQSGFDLPVASLRGVGAPTIVSAASNSLDAVFRDLGGGVSRLFWDGTRWSSEALGGSILGLPSAAVTPGPVRRVYFLGHDNMLYENTKRTGTPWSGWISVSAAAGATGTALAGSPRAVLGADSVVSVHVRTKGNQLAIFRRPSTWRLTMPGGTVFQGVPTPVPSGASWVDGAASNDVQLFSGGVWSSKGGVIE
jgi:hypothetical protein